MSYYVEYGIKRNNSMEDYDDGKAFYAGINLNYGNFGLSVEGKDYENFRILDRADGKVALNNGPSLTREHLYSLPNRYPLNQNMDDELGTQIELTWDGSNGWSALVNASRILSRHGPLARPFRKLWNAFRLLDYSFLGFLARSFRCFSPFFSRRGLSMRSRRNTSFGPRHRLTFGQTPSYK